MSRWSKEQVDSFDSVDFAIALMWSHKKFTADTPFTLKIVQARKDLEEMKKKLAFYEADKEDGSKCCGACHQRLPQEDDRICASCGQRI